MIPLFARASNCNSLALFLCQKLPVGAVCTGVSYNVVGHPEEGARQTKRLRCVKMGICKSVSAVSSGIGFALLAVYLPPTLYLA
jgi:hypothetical protein